MGRASIRAKERKETQHFCELPSCGVFGEKKKKKHDLDVATDSIKLLRAQTEASSSYPVLFFSIPLSVVWRLTRKAVHKQNGFQLSFRCFGLDLNKMRFVFAHMYAWVCVCVYVRVYVCACLLRYHTTWNFSPSRRQLSLNILIMQSYPRESERSWTECIIRSSYLCHTARSY